MNPVAAAFEWACRTELEAFKPGNVSVYAEGHGMTVAQFEKSARACAEIIAQPGLSVGERIYRSIAATQQAVGCNTNLGIVLLCAPLVHSALVTGSVSLSLRERLTTTLARLDVAASEWVFAAIRLANPGGLGRSREHDVNAAPAAGLVEVMRAAERRDRIAYQYTHDFIDVFELGLAAFAEGLRRDFTPAWAALGVYLAFLARFPDTHIRRKLGAATAAAVQRDGARLYQRYAACRQPQQLIEPLSAWDSSLKQRGINPGTSADLTVASLLTHRLLRLEQEHCEFEGWASAWSPHIIQRQTRRNSHGKNQ